MLPKSQNYNTIWNDPSHYAETKLVVGGTTYGENVIMGLDRTQTLFADYYNIGNTVMGQIQFSLTGVTAAQLPRMSRVEVWTRLWLGDGSDSTDWLPMGVYYTAKPDYDTEAQLLTVTGYDEMFKANVVPFAQGSQVTAWTNPTIRQVATHLTSGTAVTDVIDSNFSGIGVALEDPTQIDNTIIMPSIPYNYTAREILGEIAVACCGNWVVVFQENSGNQVAKLRLVTMADMQSANVSQAIGRNVTAFTKGDTILPVNDVRVYYGYDSNGVALYEGATSFVAGNNLFNINANPIEQGAIASANGEDTGNATRVRTNGYVSVSPSTQYTLSASTSKVFVLQYKGDKSYTNLSSGWQSGAGYTFTTGATTEYVRFVFANANDSAIVPTDLSWVMLNTGSSALPYEPYIDPVAVGREYTTELKTFPDSTQAQAIAYSILAGLGTSIPPYDASGSELDIACELGDKITINGITTNLGAITTVFNQGMWADISSPSIPTDDEFGYESGVQRAVDRAERTGEVNKAQISVNADSIQAEVQRATSAESDMNKNLRSTITQTADDVTIMLEQYAQDQVNNHAVEQQQYIRYSVDGLELGEAGTNAKAILTNTALQFYDPTDDVKAYIGLDSSDNTYKFFVINGHIVRQLELGSHWLLVASGSDNDNRLTFKWRA